DKEEPQPGPHPAHREMVAHDPHAPISRGREDTVRPGTNKSNFGLRNESLEEGLPQVLGSPYRWRMLPGRTVARENTGAIATPTTTRSTGSISMGGFYGSVQVKSGDRDRVKAVADRVARARQIRMLVGPVLNDWVGVYPEHSGQDETVGQE